MKVNSQLCNSQRPRRVPRMLVLLGVGVLGVGSFAGCAKARAESVPEGPPLQIPTPPERALIPVEEPVLAQPVPVTEPPAVVSAPRTPPRSAPPAKPQPAPPAAAQAPPPPAPAVEQRELRAASPASAPTERSVRDVLARAQRDLARVDYAKLSSDGRLQYEQSKRFSVQAEEALKERNLIFAATLADKAATLAAELAAR